MNDNHQIAISTNHAKKRTKDRTGLSKKLADKNAQKALDFGITHGETKGSLKKLIDALYFKNKSANNIRIYHRDIYIFQNEVLITIIDLPNRYAAAADKLQKRKKADAS